MENSAKALEIAAVMLISIMLLTLASYLFVSTGISSNEFYKQMEENQINKFNAQFLKYDGVDFCTAHDVVSAANLAKDNNLKYELTQEDAGNNSYYIKVTVKPKSGYIINNFETEDESTYMDFISDYSLENSGSTAKIRKYKCNVDVSEKTKRVYYVEFIEQ